jgi:hypothetical protein
LPRHDPDNPYITPEHRVYLKVKASIEAQDRRAARRARAAKRASSPEEIAADVLTEFELERGEDRRRDDYSSVRDEAASDCGMVHLADYLLMRQPAVALHHGRIAVPEGMPCAINGWRPQAPLLKVKREKKKGRRR